MPTPLDPPKSSRAGRLDRRRLRWIEHETTTETPDGAKVTARTVQLEVEVIQPSAAGPQRGARR